MRRQHFVLSFLVLIFAGLLTYYSARFGYYPTLIVNGQWIFASRVAQEARASYTYYIRLAETQKMTLNPAAVANELQRATLERFVEKTLVSEELKSRLGGRVAAAVNRKIDAAVVRPAELSSAAKTLYGLDSETFRRLMLEPQAEIDVLREELAANGLNYDEWLAQQKAAASVQILFTPYRWNGEKMVGL